MGLVSHTKFVQDRQMALGTGAACKCLNWSNLCGYHGLHYHASCCKSQYPE